MFEIGWSEIALIAAVALVVIGPKDLPAVLRTVGQWVRKARALSREFQSGLDTMMREAEIDDLKKQAQSMRDFNFQQEVEKTVDPTGTLRHAFDAPDLAGTASPAVPNSAVPYPAMPPAPAGPAVISPAEQAWAEEDDDPPQPAVSKPTAPPAVPSALAEPAVPTVPPEKPPEKSV